MELLPIVVYELCAVPPSLTGEYGFFRRGNKTILVHKPGVKHHKPPRPDIIIVDARELLYHVVWRCGGSVGVLAESLKARLALCAATEKSSFLTFTLKYRQRTMRGSGELVLAPLHSTLTSTALCQIVR